MREDVQSRCRCRLERLPTWCHRAKGVVREFSQMCSCCPQLSPARRATPTVLDVGVSIAELAALRGSHLLADAGDGYFIGGVAGIFALPLGADTHAPFDGIAKWSFDVRIQH